MHAQKNTASSIPRRAVGKTDKTAKREHILKATSELLGTTPFEDITVAAIARAAGIAKGTFFLYFETREAVFFELAAESSLAFFASVQDELSSPGLPERGEEGLTNCLLSMLGVNTTLMSLYPLIGTIIEKNVTHERLRDFKRALHAGFLETGSILEKQYPAFRPGEGAQFMYALSGILSGFINLTSGDARLKQLCREENLTLFLTELKPLLTSTLTALVRGYFHRIQPDDTLQVRVDSSSSP